MTEKVLILILLEVTQIILTMKLITISASSLNPYSTGSNSNSMDGCLCRYWRIVLILILLEVTQILMLSGNFPDIPVS